MNPLADSFETMLVKKAFSWCCMFFIALAAAGMISQFQYSGYRLPSVPLLLLIRAATVLFNGVVLFSLARSPAGDGFSLRLPPIVTAGNLLFSLLSIVCSGDDIIVGMGAYLVFSIIYLMIFGFFIRNQVFTVFLGLSVIAVAVLLFVVFPDRFFRQRFEFEEMRFAWLYVLLFGLAVATVLVTLSNQILSMIVGRARESAERLRAMAFFDHSTGFPNGLQLEQDMKSMDESGQILTAGKLVMVGFRLEGLEALNETRGLSFTDGLVREIALAYRYEIEMRVGNDPEFEIPGCFRPMYRVESNSFIYVLKMPGSSLRSLSSQRILSSVIERLTTVREGRASLAFQGGFTVFPDDASSLDQLFRNLLNLLHSRRNESLGQFVCFNPGHYLEFLRQEELRSGLDEAMAAGEFSLVYQPKIELEGGRVTGFEALARWRSPAFGVVSPAEFIPLAERSGSIASLTLYLLDAVYDFIRLLRRENHAGIRVSANLSPGLLNPDFLDRIIDDIEKNGLGPFLELEITEGVLMKLNPLISSKFGALKRLGVGFSIDDFGTGYSNLGYLQNFEADVLKIDKRFIDGIPLDVKNGKLVEAIMRMARSFDMKVVAEGVEYREQRDFLRERGCDQIQGYFYSKPLPAADAIGFLSANA